MEEELDLSKELEQLRSDYSLLKKKLDEQEIVNDRNMLDSVRVKVDAIMSQERTVITCSLIAMCMSPMYHLAFGASWWFCGATFLFMAYSYYSTLKRCRSVASARLSGRNMMSVTNTIRYYRNEYSNWLNVGFPLCVVWILWLFLEIYMHTESRTAMLVISGAVLCALGFGIAVGLGVRATVIRSCDAIIGQVKK